MSGSEPNSAPAIPRNGIVPDAWQKLEGDGDQSGKGNAWIANAAGEGLNLESRTKTSASKPRNRAILLQHFVPRRHDQVGRDQFFAICPCQGIADLWGTL
jgi:hypothetical protein